MQTSEHQSVADIRRHATDKNRVTNSKHKWHPRWESPVLPSTKVVDGKSRPCKLESHYRERCPEAPYKDSQRHQSKINRKRNPLREDADLRCGSSSDECSSSDDPSEEVKGIEQVTFSYDAPSGPSRGSDVLGAALSKAVQRFEDHQTTLLVQEEYDLLSNVAEDDIEPLLDDDDYELV